MLFDTQHVCTSMCQGILATGMVFTRAGLFVVLRIYISDVHSVHFALLVLSQAVLSE